MNRQELANKYFNAIMELHGIDEFKAMIERLRTFQQNKEKYSVPDVTLPNYLWAAKRGGGISTCINLFAEYLYNAKVIEFSGIVIPHGITSIAENTFSECISLTDIDLPGTVTYIGKNAFEGCNSLTIYAQLDSTAWHYAKDNNIKCEPLNYHDYQSSSI